MTTKLWRFAPLLLFVGFLALYWFGNGSHGLWDEDEPRYAQATREMLASGDFIHPTFNGNDRFEKPIMIYWLMMIPMGLFGENEFTARAVSGVSGALTLVLMFFFAQRIGCGRREALAVSLMTGLFALILLIAKAAVIDATLTVVVVAIMWMLWEQVTAGFRWWRHVLIWVLVGVSILLKGPPGPMIAGLAMLMFMLWNRWKPLATARPAIASMDHARRWATGLAIMLAVYLPWGIAIGLSSNWEFYVYAVGDQVGDRVTTAMEGHKGPFFYYLVVLIPGLFPFTGLVLSSMRWVWGQHQQEIIRFLWSWFLPAFVVFSAIPTKLPHYSAPLMPALALMVGLWLTELSRGRGHIPRGWWRVGGILTAVIGLIMAAGLPTGAVLAEIEALFIPVVFVGVLILAVSLFGGLLLMRGDVARAIPTLGFGWAAVLLTILVWALPTFDAVRPSRVLTGWIRENAPAGVHYFASEYRVSSLPFNHGDRVEMLSNARPKSTADRMREEPVWVLTTTRHRWNEWTKEQEKDGNWTFPEDIQKKASFELFYAEKGKWEEYVIFGNW